MLSITGGNATISRSEGVLRAAGTVNIHNAGRKDALVLRMATENHLLLSGQPIGSSGGGMSRFGVIPAGGVREVPFGVGIGNAATAGNDPLRFTLYAGLRIEYTVDDGETVEDVNLWASAASVLVDDEIEKPVSKIDRPAGELYDISLDEI